MVETLASGLTGALFSHDTDFDTHPGNQTPRTGQFLLVVDPTRVGNASFAGRMAEFWAFLGKHGVDRLPTDRHYRFRDAAAERASLSPMESGRSSSDMRLRSSAACRR